MLPPSPGPSSATFLSCTPCQHTMTYYQVRDMLRRVLWALVNDGMAEQEMVRIGTGLALALYKRACVLGCAVPHFPQSKRCGAGRKAGRRTKHCLPRFRAADTHALCPVRARARAHCRPRRWFRGAGAAAAAARLPPCLLPHAHCAGAVLHHQRHLSSSTRACR